MVGGGGWLDAGAGPSYAGAACRAPTDAALWRRLFLHHFDVEGDGYRVTDHLVAAGHGVAHENHAEILTIDFGGGGSAAASAHDLDDFGWTSYVEGYFFRDAVKGEVAGHLGGVVAGVCDFCGLKSAGGIFGYVEDVIAFEIVSRFLHPGSREFDVMVAFDFGFENVLVVNLNCDGYLVNSP